MGVTAAVVATTALSAASSIGNYNSAKSNARATLREGRIAAQNRADEISRLAARQRVLYLHAGLELEGTPQAVVNDTYNTGIADVRAIRSSYSQQAQNIMKQARANLMGSMAKTAVNAYTMSNMTDSTLATQDVTGTAASGDNVTFTDASYGGLNSSAFVGGNSFSAKTSATQARLSSLL